MFGLAWAYKLSLERRYFEAALDTLKYLDLYFTSPTGGYFTVLPPEFERRDQNPHMHLFEAMLAWHDVTGEAQFLARAGEISTL